MPIDTFRDVTAYPRGLGHEIVLSILMPESYPEDTRVLILKSTSEITPDQVNNYLATTTIPNGITAELWHPDMFPLSDFEVVNGTRYYYALCLVQVSETEFTDHSEPFFIAETPVGTIKSKVLDAASLVMRILKTQFLPKFEYKPGKDIELRWSMNNLNPPYPVLTVARGRKLAFQQFLGRHIEEYARELSSGEVEIHEVLGQIDTDIVSVKIATLRPEQRTDFVIAFKSFELEMHNLLHGKEQVVDTKIEYLGDSEVFAEKDSVLYIHEFLISVIHEIRHDYVNKDYATGVESSLGVEA